MLKNPMDNNISIGLAIYVAWIDTVSNTKTIEIYNVQKVNASGRATELESHSHRLHHDADSP